MKRIILAIVALVVSWLFANAQFSAGIKAGYNSSLALNNISSVSSGSYTLKSVGAELGNGFHAGVFARIGKKLYVQPELLYAMQKKQYQLSIQDITNPDLSVDKFITFSTVDVPVMIGYKLVDAKLLNVSVFAGPKFRLNAGSTLDFKNLTSGATIDENQLRGEFEKATTGAEIGAGVDLLMFTLDARLQLISDVYQAKWQSKPDLNSNFVISLGWKF